VAREDYQWGVFTQDHKKLELSWTKGDCESIIESWEGGTPIPASEDYNLEFPEYIGSKRIDLFNYRMNTPEGVFIIRKLPGRKTGDFRWGIFRTHGELVAEHFSRAECEGLVREWASAALRRPNAGALPTNPPPQGPEVENWRAEEATNAQKNLLKSKGITASSGLTKGEASDQIDSLLHGISEGQKRRLAFYQIATVGLTKEEASESIDRYAAEHPEAEQQYQDWKASQLTSHPPSSMDQREWKDAVREIKNRTVAGGMDLPDSSPGDEPASVKQLEYIRSLVREIDESQLQRLTKPQAHAVIEEILKQKGNLAKQTAQQLLARQASPDKTISVKFIAMVGLLVIIVIATLYAFLSRLA
jgi:hypothetical protein